MTKKATRQCRSILESKPGELQKRRVWCCVYTQMINDQDTGLGITIGYPKLKECKTFDVINLMHPGIEMYVCTMFDVLPVQVHITCISSFLYDVEGSVSQTSYRRHLHVVCSGIDC